MSEPKKFSFVVLALEDIDGQRGHVFRVRLKSKEGHKLVLEAATSAIFEGLPKGATLLITMAIPQTTLPTLPALPEGES